MTGNPQTKGANGQRSGTGDQAPKGPRTVRVLTPERVAPTATSQDPRVFAPRCQDRESDPFRLRLRGHPGFKYPYLMPQGEEEASQTEGVVPNTPSPVLFSSDDQAVPLGEEECEEIG